MTEAYHPFLNQYLQRDKSPAIQHVFSKYAEDFEQLLENFGTEAHILEFTLGHPLLADKLSNTAHIEHYNLLPFDGASTLSDGSHFEYQDQSIDAIFALDIFHLLNAPKDFFLEMNRILKPGGLLFIVGPGTAIGTYPFYRLFNNQHFNLEEIPLEASQSSDIPYKGNVARLWLQFFRMEHHIALMEHVPDLKTTRKEWRNMASYPLANIIGKHKNLADILIPMAHKIDKILEVWLGQWISSRLVITMEKRQKTEKNGPTQNNLNGPLFR